jgi:UDP-N-acetyl-D-glucosamine dehydrogenase
MHHNELMAKLKSRKARIGIIGLGYVGLPLAAGFAKKGFNVTGFEVDGKKAASIKKGVSYIADVPSATVKQLVSRGLLGATTDFSRLRHCDTIIICVPTPLRKSKDPDVSYIVSATEKVAAVLRKGQLIVLESTTYPGTTRELVMPMLEDTGLKCGKDFFLAFSPERVDPSNKTYTIENTPKLVGGITPCCGELGQELYTNVTVKSIMVSSPEAAEMVKLLENTFRAVNIALVNEVALMCDRLKLDVWEIIDAAATKPFGFMPFYPGPGIGGHCIPLDPHYLSWKLKTLNFYPRFIELAGEMNSKMPEHLVDRIGSALNTRGLAFKNSRVLILGMAYKKDVSDVRESPALDVCQLLREKQAKIDYYDPFIPSVEIAGIRMKSIKNLKNIGAYDVAVITTNHSAVDYRQVVKRSRIVVDSRNATKGIKSPKIIKL